LHFDRHDVEREAGANGNQVFRLHSVLRLEKWQ
jgi:hypothetical protein